MKEIEECQCPQAGYCEFFRQEMTYDPPNWQWCQGTSKQERNKYRIDCDKKHKRKRIFLDAEYVSTAQLIQDCKDLILPQIANLNIRGIVGVPRSGMLPASMIALWLNLPLYFIDTSGDVKILSASTNFGGRRMDGFIHGDGKLLVIDDTIYSGTAIDNVKDRIKEDAIYSAVYVHPSSKDKVDIFARELPPPHLLEWNLFNCTYIELALLDFDGIFSPNVPYEKCQNEEDYIDYIKNVEPFYHRIPKTYCKGIVTARLEKYRSITEEWLKRYNIKYGFLKMFPNANEEKRNKNHVEEAANFKSKIFSESNAEFFIESEISEAVLIRRKTNKFVICPEEHKPWGSFNGN